MWQSTHVKYKLQILKSHDRRCPFESIFLQLMHSTDSTHTHTSTNRKTVKNIICLDSNVKIITWNNWEWTTPFPSFIPLQLQFYYNCPPRQNEDRMTSSSHWSNTSIVRCRHFYGFAHFHTFMLTFQKSRAAILWSRKYPAFSTQHSPALPQARLI